MWPVLPWSPPLACKTVPVESPGAAERSVGFSVTAAVSEDLLEQPAERKVRAASSTPTGIRFFIEELKEIGRKPAVAAQRRLEFASQWLGRSEWANGKGEAQAPNCCHSTRPRATASVVAGKPRGGARGPGKTARRPVRNNFSLLGKELPGREGSDPRGVYSARNHAKRPGRVIAALCRHRHWTRNHSDSQRMNEDSDVGYFGF